MGADPWVVHSRPQAPWLTKPSPGSVHRHEDGTVRFWDASGVCLRLLYRLSTVKVFLTDTDLSENLSAQGEDEWPPLRKVRPGAWESGCRVPS